MVGVLLTALPSLLPISVALVDVVAKVETTQLSTVILNLSTLVDNARQEEDDSNE